VSFESSCEEDTICEGQVVIDITCNDENCCGMWAVGVDAIAFRYERGSFANVGQIWRHVMLVLFGVVDGTNEDTFVPFETCQSEIYADGGKELSPASWAILHAVEMASHRRICGDLHSLRRIHSRGVDGLDQACFE